MYLILVTRFLNGARDENTSAESLAAARNLHACLWQLPLEMTPYSEPIVIIP